MITLVDYTCSLCGFVLEGIDKPFTTKQTCPICDKGLLMSVESSIKKPTETEIVVPDVHRDYNWCLENLESEAFLVAMKSLYVHCLKAFKDVCVCPEALRYIELNAIRLINTYNNMPFDKKTQFIQGWLDAVIISLLDMSRMVRMTHVPKMKLNGVLEREYLIYKKLPRSEVESLNNVDWE